jgi:hypothetical protein
LGHYKFDDVDELGKLSVGHNPAAEPETSLKQSGPSNQRAFEAHGLIAFRKATGLGMKMHGTCSFDSTRTDVLVPVSIQATAVRMMDLLNRGSVFAGDLQDKQPYLSQYDAFRRATALAYLFVWHCTT